MPMRLSERVANRVGVLTFGFLIVLTIVLRDNRPWCQEPDNEPFCAFGDHIYVVTVASRRARVSRALAAIGIRANIVAAHGKPRTARDWAAVRRSRQFVPDTLDTLTSGEVAVSLSQREALRRFLATSRSEGDRALIFEDDFQSNGFGIRERLRESLRAAERVQPPVDVLFLGRCHDNCDRDRHVGGDLYRVTNPACLHAYSVNRRAALAVIAAARACTGPNCPIDNVVRELVRRPIPPGRSGEVDASNDSALAGYAISPQLFTQEEAYRVEGKSLVRADEADLERMKPEGEHWVHALRRGNPKLEKTDAVAECKRYHERLLISNVNQFADRTAFKPKPKRTRIRRAAASKPPSDDNARGEAGAEPPQS